FLLLASLLFLPPLAQAKDKDEVVQKADILFKTEAKASPEAKKPATQTSGSITASKPTSSPTPATKRTKEVAKKEKALATTPSKGTPPGPTPSVKGPGHYGKESAVATKTLVPVPAMSVVAQPPSAGVTLPPPSASKPTETSLADTKQAVSTSPAEPKVAEPLPVSGTPKADTTPLVAETPPAKEVALLPSTAVVPVSTTASQNSLQETLQQAYECLQKDKKYEARNLYSQALFMETSEERRQLIRKHLEELNNVLVFSSTPSPDFFVYKVQPGDNLARIAKQYNTTAELIMRLNRKSSPLLRIGEPLKILRGKTALLVDKSDFTLTLLLDGHYLKQYPIGLGKNDKTPEGRFLIKNKMKEPTWFSPDGKIYPYGSQQNILGTRWLGFQNQPGLVGYGIHGTTEPESIGTESSNGCVRMLNQDVEELYDYVTPNTEVIIQR
ncbi:MAG: L,D-transpeptidase family protein, partial [Candidatus Brocadiales bacterium]